MGNSLILFIVKYLPRDPRDNKATKSTPKVFYLIVSCACACFRLYCYDVDFFLQSVKRFLPMLDTFVKAILTRSDLIKPNLSQTDRTQILICTWRSIYLFIYSWDTVGLICMSNPIYLLQRGENDWIENVSNRVVCSVLDKKFYIPSFRC